MVYLYIHKNDTRSSSEQLKSCTEDYCRKNHIPVPDQKAYGKHGKPFYPGSSIHFSISHSGELWGCAFSENEIGFDIQKFTAADTDRLSNRFYSQSEHDHCLNDASLFFRLWAIKEAYAKYTGDGIRIIKPEFDVYSEYFTNGTVNMIPCTYISLFDGYSCAICTDETKIRIE